MPVVSIVTPFFNAERFIEETIESVFAQTYDNWELLLIDDGSTDRSTEIVLKYVKQYPEKVRYFEHEGHQNRGSSAARNLGIHHARGDYIAFLDSDDVWLKEKLKKQITILESSSRTSVVFGNTERWHSWTGNAGNPQGDFIPDLGLKHNFLYEPPALLVPLLRRTVPVTSSFLVRRSAIAKTGGFEEAFRGLFDDQVFFIKLFAQVPVFVSGMCLERYRHHPDSCCRVAEKIGNIDSVRFDFLNWVEQYFSEHSEAGAEARKVLKRELMPYKHPMLYYWIRKRDNLALLTSETVNKTKRRIMLKSSGSLYAYPNPVKVPRRLMEGTTTLSWTSKNTTMVEVHVGSPDGPLFSRTGSSGTKIAGPWVRDGTVFYLQDVADKKPLTKDYTLSTVVVRVIPDVRVTRKIFDSLLRGKFQSKRLF